jgi:nicotinamidase-related amidase
MTEFVWEDLLSEQDKDVIRKAGYKHRGAVSNDTRSVGESPAILVIDVQEDQVGPDAPIIDAIDTYPTAMGEIAWRAIENIQSILTVARDNEIPIFYFQINRSKPDLPTEATEIHEAVEPQESDEVITKNHSSAFHGTDCITHLVEQGIDTTIVVGSSASGCVRATAVDAQQNGFDVVIPQDCVFDRIQVSAKITLLDLWMKYAAVLERKTVEDYLRDPVENSI